MYSGIWKPCNPRTLKDLNFEALKLESFKTPEVFSIFIKYNINFKARVVQYGQQRHIMDEKNILSIMESPFVLGLHRTFKDKKFVYLLTDAYLGGDLWRTLHVKDSFLYSFLKSL